MPSLLLRPDYKNIMTPLYLGDQLRCIRKLYEKKQTDVAECLGVSTRQYSKMENNKVPLKHKYITKLAEYYDLTTDQIIHFDMPKLINSIEIQKNTTIIPQPENAKELSDPAYYRRLLVAKESVIQSQKEFIDFLQKKHKSIES